jgi:hypothetical protein
MSAASAVRVALEDAFAALMAGQQTRAARARVQALAAGARRIAAARPDAAGGPHRPPAARRGDA